MTLDEKVIKNFDEIISHFVIDKLDNEIVVNKFLEIEEIIYENFRLAKLTQWYNLNEDKKIYLINETIKELKKHAFISYKDKNHNLTFSLLACTSVFSMKGENVIILEYIREYVIFSIIFYKLLKEEKEKINKN